MELDLFGIRKRHELLKNALKREVERMIKPESQAYLQGWQESQETKGRSPGVNYRTLEEVYKKESWVRACIDVIQRTATSNSYRLVPTAKASQDVVNKQEVKDIAALLENPNSEDTFTDLLAEIVIDLHTYGDAYVEIARDKKGVPRALYNIYVPSVRIKVDEHGTIIGYIQKPMGYVGNHAVEFDPQDILHIRLPNPGNAVYGLSPLESLLVAVETDLYAQTYNKHFFKNYATPRLHIDLGNCTLGQLKRMREYFEVYFKGAHNAHKTIVTEGGAKITSIGTKPNDMEFLNQRKFSRDEICAVFGVPPMKLGVFEDVNRASSMEADKTFKSEKIIPLQRMIAKKINNRIISQFGSICEDIKFEFVELDLRDALQQAEIDKLDIESGVVTIEEVRLSRGLGPKPEVKEDIKEEQEDKE